MDYERIQKPLGGGGSGGGLSPAKLRNMLLGVEKKRKEQQQWLEHEEEDKKAVIESAITFTSHNQAGPPKKFLQSFGNNYRSTIYHHPYPINHRSCGNRDISISQSKDSGTAGIPEFIVQIMNTCTISSGCSPSDIHLYCGWFASARMVNPRTFKRLSYDDCLVNGGKPLKSNQMIRFTYSNSFMYSLAFKSAKFC